VTVADPPGGFTPYELSYSGKVRDELAALIARATVNGRDQSLLTALRNLEYRLRVYPQFGQPLRDSTAESAQEWLGVVPPLVVRYIIYEDQRLVCVVRPITPLPRSGY
jgi:hypothetical protein